jgi:hypothetical protein
MHCFDLDSCLFLSFVGTCFPHPATLFRYWRDHLERHIADQDAGRIGELSQERVLPFCFSFQITRVGWVTSCSEEAPDLLGMANDVVAQSVALAAQAITLSSRRGHEPGRSRSARVCHRRLDERR